MKQIIIIITLIIVLSFLAAPAYADEPQPRPPGYADAAATKVASQHRPEPTHRPTVTPTLNPYPAPYPEPEGEPWWDRLVSWIVE